MEIITMIEQGFFFYFNGRTNNIWLQI